MKQHKLIAPRVTGELIERFWERVYRPSHDLCWLFIGGKNPRQYQNIGGIAVHRLSWFLANGTDPGCLLVCHQCDTPHCVNPRHLWLGTNQDNRMDSQEKGRRRGAHRGGPELGQGDVLRNDQAYIELAQRLKSMRIERGMQNLRPYMGRFPPKKGSQGAAARRHDGRTP